jgi:hypothetical protein
MSKLSVASRHARALSSGTMAGLIHCNLYPAIEAAKTDFVAFIDAKDAACGQPVYGSWKKAWSDYQDNPMDRDLREAASWLAGKPYQVVRCRHPSLVKTSLWIMTMVGKQIGSASRVDDRWKANRVHHGMPTSERRVESLVDALTHIVSITI